MAAGGTHLGKSEIQNLGVAAIGDEDIRRLDIAVDDALRMRHIEGVGNFNGEVLQILQFHRAARDGVFQRLAFQIFHGDEGGAILLADIMDRADVGMIQGRGGLRFALKARQRLRVLGNLIGQKFQRHEAVETGVFGFIDNAHSAATEFFQYLVVRDCLAGQRLRIRHVHAILWRTITQVNVACGRKCVETSKKM